MFKAIAAGSAGDVPAECAGQCHVIAVMVLVNRRREAGS